MSRTGRHYENWLSGTPTVQCTVQTAESSEVVASVADAFTSVTVLTTPAVPGDLTAAAEFVLCVFYPFYGSALGTCLLTSRCCAVRSFPLCSTVSSLVFLLLDLDHWSGVCAVRGVQELGFHES